MDYGLLSLFIESAFLLNSTDDYLSVHFCFFSTKTIVIDSCCKYSFGEYELFYPLEDVDKDDKDC